MPTRSKTSALIALITGLSLCVAPAVFASDHGDTPALNPAGGVGARHDARITDSFALKRGDKLALIVDTNPTLRQEPSYTFPTDVTFRAYVDNHTTVVADPVLSPILGGSFADPSLIKENIAFAFTFDANNQLKVTLSSPDTTLGISGFYPEQAARGSLVYVLGSGFDRGNTQVRVNGRIALLSYVLSKNVLVFVTPGLATTGSIRVTTGAGSATTASALTVTPYAGLDFSTLLALGTIQNAQDTLAAIEAGDVASLAKIGLPVQTFAGLRDDPFIRGPQKGRNIAAMAVELPLSLFTHGRQKTLVSWASSNVACDDPAICLSPQFAATEFEEVAGRSFGSMFSPEQLVINNLHPSQHVAAMGGLALPQLGGRTVPPDVMIFDTSKPQSFPNGRELNDDIIDLIAPNDTRVEGLRAGETLACAASNDPLDCPTGNDVPHSASFPYLGEQRVAPAP